MLPGSQDFAELLHRFDDEDVRYLVVGALAVGFYDRPRATADFDVWVDATPENARRVYRALAAFGAPLARLTADDFAQDDVIFQIGVPPLRIDVITSIDGVVFADAWPRRVTASIADLTVQVIGFDDLVANKVAAGRSKDAKDVRNLRRSQRKGK